MDAKIPHNIDQVIALVESVDESELSPEQKSAIREILQMDNPLTIAERTEQSIGDVEVLSFLDELQFRQKTSPWVLLRANRIYRLGTESQRQQVLTALEPFMGNDYVRKAVLEGVVS